MLPFTMVTAWEAAGTQLHYHLKIYTPGGYTLSYSLDTGNDHPAPKLQTEEICTDEICDFIDNDCDGLVDEEGAQRRSF